MRSINEKLWKAAESGDEAGLKKCLAHPKCDPMSRGEGGWVALMFAASSGHKACVQLLLPVSDALAQSGQGLTALMWATCFGKCACVQLLLPVSDISAKENRGLTASDIAREWGQAEASALIDAYVGAASEAAALDAVTRSAVPQKGPTMRV